MVKLYFAKMISVFLFFSALGLTFPFSRVLSQELKSREAIKKDDLVIRRFRKNLSKSAIYPIRKGDKIDLDKFIQIIRTFAHENSALIKTKFTNSLASLLKKEIPMLDKYDRLERYEIDEKSMESKYFEISSFLYPDIRHLAMISINTMVHRSMAMKRAITTAEIGGWAIFFNYALPDFYRCGSGEGKTVICIDYDKDLFILYLREIGPIWNPAIFEWWRKKDKP